MNDLKTILLQIDTVFKKISESQQMPDKLLLHANQLSSLKYNLGDLYINARADSKASEAQLDFEFSGSFMKYKKEGNSDATARTLAKIDCRDRQVEYLDLERLTTTLWIKREDVAEKISVLQSYARELRDQKSYKTM